MGEDFLASKVGKYLKDTDNDDNSYKNEKPSIYTLAGGSLSLSNGASIKVEQGSSSKFTNVSMSITTNESLLRLRSHDKIEGATMLCNYTLEPHGAVFDKPILFSLPYVSTTPKERLGVFYMEAELDGTPVGTWKMISDVAIDCNLVLFAADHFSYYAIFEFADISLKRRAHVTRATKTWQAIAPGLSYSGVCANTACQAFNNQVVCRRGFGTFQPIEDKEFGEILCPVCEKSFDASKFILFDTMAHIKWVKEDSTKGNDACEVIDDAADVFGIDPNGLTKTCKYKFLKIQTSARPGSSLNVDICFAMDCTQSMQKYIDAGKDQIKSLVEGVQSDLGNMNMNGKLRVSFIGYRDFPHAKLLKFDSEQVLKVVHFTEDVDSMTNVIAEQKAEGGGDMPEHIVGALKAATEMDWKGSVRVFVLISDAPCHGRDYHNLQDNFPAGDPTGLIPEVYLRQMVAKDIIFFFMRIHKRTDMMIQKFRQTYDNVDKGLAIEVMELGTNANMLGNLIQNGIMRKIDDLL